MKKRTFRALTLILGLVVLTASLASCVTSTSPSPSSEGTAASPSLEPSKEPAASVPAGNRAITLMASQNYIKDVDRELFKAFEAETGIEVKVLVTPDGNYETLLGTSLADGSNAIDMFMYSGGNMMVSMGIHEIALDLSDQEWVGRLVDWAREANAHEGKMYGFSTWSIDYEGILYNKTFFEENGLSIPTSWGAFMTLCDKILTLGKIPLYESINGTWHTSGWFYGLTPALIKANPNFVANMNDPSSGVTYATSPKTKEGLDQIYQLISAKEGSKPKYYTNDGQSEDFFGSYPSLLARDTIMMFTYSSYANELKDQGSTDVWGMFPMPAAGNDCVVTNGGGISKFVNKNSDYIEECKELLNFLSRPENLQKFYDARADLINPSFEGVNVAEINATKEAEENSNGTPPTMLLKTVLYFDPDMYKYFQGFADGSVTVDEFIANVDAYRTTMFEAAGE